MPRLSVGLVAMSVSIGPSGREEPSLGAPARNHHAGLGHLPGDESRRKQLAWLHLHPDNDIPRSLHFGAPAHIASRLVVATPPDGLRVLYEVHGWYNTVPRFQPWLEDIAGQLPASAVSEIDVHTFYDDETTDDGARNALAAVNASVPLGPHERPEDVWGCHELLQETWDYFGSERDRIIARARAMAHGLGLDGMTNDAL